MRKLLLAVLTVAALGTSAPTAHSAGLTVRLKDNVFSPTSKTVDRNTIVTFRWAGYNAHNIKVTKGPVKFHSSTKITGIYKRKMSASGRYTIVCTLHPGMTFKLHVR